MINTIIRKIFSLGIMFIVMGGLFVPCSQSSLKQRQNNQLSTDEQIKESTQDAIITCYTFGRTGSGRRNVVLSIDEAILIFQRMKQLESALTINPDSKNTQSLKKAFIDMLDEKDLLSNTFSKEVYHSMLTPQWIERLQNQKNKGFLPQSFGSRGTSALCSIGSGGSGVLVPLFLLPRPRLAMMWLGTGLTQATSFVTTRGYIAEGAQTGFALGFMGIGLTYAVPGYMLYGFIGYAVLASTTADYVVHYPPNSAPEILDIQPADGEQNIPLSLSELQFRIQDPDGDLMSYTVTTDPDIGSDSGNLKPFGVYKVPVSGLQDLTTYTWHIMVTDGKDTTEQTATFTTAAVAPIISNPVPEDTERDVPMNLPQLQFTLKDYQGDTMEYTVQTSPDIGSDHKTGVHDGTYTVPISGMTYGLIYRWYVNVTDGMHWTRKVFSFSTGYPSPFDPFDYGWQYRKPITINHELVTDDLEDFPVLLSITDSDLMKAQVDGDDLLFMNSVGASVKLCHELEEFDQGTGALVAWVKIPSMSAEEDTVFYLYYGNPSCINQEYPEKTWDSNYVAVWHMDDATSTTISDSTINSITGTKKAINTPTEWSGKTGRGQLYNRSSTVWEYITMGDSDLLEFSGDFSVSAWIKPFSEQDMKVAGKHQEYSGDYYGYAINWNVGPQPKMSLRVDNGGFKYEYTYADQTASPNIWYYLTGIKRYGTNYLYSDGVQQTDTGTQTLANSNQPFCIGAWKTDGADANFYGIIDEVRVSKIGRSSSWIQTEYHNQNSPSTFLTFGSEEPGP